MLVWPCPFRRGRAWSIRFAVPQSVVVCWPLGVVPLFTGRRRQGAQPLKAEDIWAESGVRIIDLSGSGATTRHRMHIALDKEGTKTYIP